MLNIILGVCNNPCATFTLPNNICFKFLLGITVKPQEKAKTMLVHFFVQVYLGQCENGEFDFSFLS